MGKAEATQEFRLRVNGSEHGVTADPDRMLLSVLRDDLGLLGTRTGCLAGNCGACTVMVDGRAVQSCDTPLWIAAKGRIDSIDGHDGANAPPEVARVRAAFLAEQAAQCGYCVNGIIMTVASLLAGGARPARAEVLRALDERHLCRCGAHPRMLRAIDRLLVDGGAA